ncbi:MAG: proprotein convertase P-domain-containing protein, partial [Saprospiraceae bacterium]|nr:proprotein convertase P-domain-containing protein [Saprospiraceae bacterium]
MAVLAGTFFLSAGLAFSQIDVVAGTGAPLIDASYDGTLGSMVCAELDNSSGTVVSVNEVLLNVSITHTWVGDLTIKVVSPSSTILTVLSRAGLAMSPDDGSGCCGHSADLDGTTLLFANGGTFDAEEMGSAGVDVCTEDGQCDFFPNPDPGTPPVPPGTDFNDFDGETGIGLWQVCVGDSAAGDIGEFLNAALTIQGAIPVELISFEATINGQDVTLNWETASETNNAGFEVQMQDGENWTVLGFVDGHGTTTEAQTYSYTAEGVGVGTHVFRLKQIDYDGQFEYHGNVEVTVETPGTHVLSNAYPNPFNPQSQFTLAVAQDQLVTAELYNALGQRVATLFNGTVEADQSQLVTI